MSHYGQDTFMWSNDYPHAASTWPHSRRVIAEELGHLAQAVLRKVVRENVIKLYDLRIDGVNASPLRLFLWAGRKAPDAAYRSVAKLARRNCSARL